MCTSDLHTSQIRTIQPTGVPRQDGGAKHGIWPLSLWAQEQGDTLDEAEVVGELVDADGIDEEKTRVQIAQTALAALIASTEKDLPWTAGEKQRLISGLTRLASYSSTPPSEPTVKGKVTLQEKEPKRETDAGGAKKKEKKKGGQQVKEEIKGNASVDVDEGGENEEGTMALDLSPLKDIIPYNYPLVYDDGEWKIPPKYPQLNNLAGFVESLRYTFLPLEQFKSNKTVSSCILFYLT